MLLWYALNAVHAVTGTGDAASFRKLLWVRGPDLKLLRTCAGPTPRHTESCPRPTGGKPSSLQVFRCSVESFLRRRRWARQRAPDVSEEQP